MNIRVKATLLALVVQLAAVCALEAVRAVPGKSKAIDFNTIDETAKSRFMQTKMAIADPARKTEDVIGLVKHNVQSSTKSDLTQVKDLRGDTLLSLAAAAGRPKVVEVLLDLGADPLVVNDLNQGPLQRARAGNFNEVVAVLLAAVGSKAQGAEEKAAEKPGKAQADETLLARAKAALKSTAEDAKAAVKSAIPTPPPLPPAQAKPAVKPAAPAEKPVEKKEGESLMDELKRTAAAHPWGQGMKPAPQRDTLVEQTPRDVLMEEIRAGKPLRKVEPKV